jgi:hypothetical protein
MTDWFLFDLISHSTRAFSFYDVEVIYPVTPFVVNNDSPVLSVLYFFLGKRRPAL